MKYIKNVNHGEGCIFCEKSAEDRDEENFILYRGEVNFILLNIYPYNTGHVMIAPYRHTGTLEELASEEAADMMVLAQRAIRVIRSEMSPDGFNLGVNISRIAGAGVTDHVHMHIVPRWSGDTNFMPVLGSTRVLPELPEETYEKLQPHFSDDVFSTS